MTVSIVIRFSDSNYGETAPPFALSKATGAGWQTRINEALRDWVATHGSRERAGIPSATIATRDEVDVRA